MFLRLKAPFAAFRPFQAGAYRSTTPVPSPSAIYGLLLNLAGIEQRADTEESTALIHQNLPTLKIAIAIPEGVKTETAVLCQQLHQYLVGNSDQKLAEKTHGAKSWIAPGRREVLVNLDVVIGLECDQWLSTQIVEGLNGELDIERYGLPFAGDNNFLFDSIEVINDLVDLNKLLRWYCRLNSESLPTRDCCRLTTWIDRGDNTKTKMSIFSPSHFSASPPESAWIQLPIEEF